MKCPVCKDITLLMSEKKGIEIDYCPECRGIWLDRGELEKLTHQEASNNNQYRNYEHNHHDHTSSQNYHHKKKKDSFLEEIFDIF